MGREPVRELWLSDGKHKVKATLSKEALQHLDAFQNNFTENCIIVINGKAFAIVTKATSLEVVMTEAPPLVISDVASQVLGNPQPITNKELEEPVPKPNNINLGYDIVYTEEFQRNFMKAQPVETTREKTDQT